MLKRNFVCGLIAALAVVKTAYAAPLFPDVKDDHWAKDAVSALAAKGLLEGYPDGTFKGDRAATRWEVAMIIARLLAKMEQAHATFATKAEADEIRKIAGSLKEELDALGVRVTNLEAKTDQLDKRVTELERITFYGYVDTRMSSNNFYNTGLPASRSTNPGVATNYINYNAAVGTNLSAGGNLPNLGGTPTVPTWNPFSTGVLTTTNWRTGRPLVSGTGFTSRGVLGLKIRINDDIDAGAEFSAFTSQGNSIVDAYYGVNAPYLNNPWTAVTTVNGGTAGLQSQNHQPFTSMNLDHFWLTHNPSKTKVILGAFNNTGFQRSVFAGFLNPNENGSEHLDNFGFQVTGRIPLDKEDSTRLAWEVMGTVVPDGNVGALPGTTGFGQSYFTHAEGGNIKYQFHDDRGDVQLNFLHVANDASGGDARTVGLIQVPNLTLNWVNPNGFYFNQLGGPNLNTGGIGSTGDVRPIPTLAALNADGSLAPQVAAGLLPGGVPNVGGIGPQDQTTYGISASYKWENEYEPAIRAEYAHSDYRPQKNSSYSVGGNAFKIAANAFFFQKQVELEATYLRVDPRFSPFIIQQPTVGGISTPFWHTPDFYYYFNQYALHDVKELPHNRQGFRVKGTWKFRPTGRITAEYGNLSQTTSSLQDVRFGAGSLGAGTPNTPVLGYSPGFIDPLFGGFSQYTFAPSGGNSLAVPLENPTGRAENLYVSAGHKWLLDEENNNRGVTLSGGIKYLKFSRDSQLSKLVGGGQGIQGENQNLVDLGFMGWHIGVDYDLTEDIVLKGGFTQVDIYGHLDPLNVTGAYAESIGSSRFNNVDITQRYPELGFEWKLTDDVTWGMEGRYYTFTDNVPTRAFTNPSLPNLNISGGPTFSHPFNWEGITLQTHFGVKF